MKTAVIVSAVRTPIGGFSGSLAKFSAPQLGTIAIKEALKRASLKPEQVDEVILGNILSAGIGQNPARQAALNAGIPNEVPCYTVNKVCGSGMKTVTLAATSIRAGEIKCAVVGGIESMSNAPYLLPKVRDGLKMGHGEVLDSMIHDGLWDVFNNYHMGITAENLAEKYSVSREEQDEFAALSQQRCEKAQGEGRFDDEIVPVEIPQRKGDPVIFSKDEHPRAGATVESLAKLRPAFKKDGTVTAGNASGINDGAAVIIVMEEEYAKSLGIKPLAKIVSYASAGVDPSIMGIGPAPASKKALEKAGWEVKDLDLIEANEAFAVQSISVNKEMGWDTDKVNVNGGAIALGHPVGASGARIIITLLHEMQKRDSKKGLATLCIGGGMGIAITVER